MPQPIVLPPKPPRTSGLGYAAQSLTQLGQMYAQGLVQQKLQEKSDERQAQLARENAATLWEAKDIPNSGGMQVILGFRIDPKTGEKILVGRDLRQKSQTTPSPTYKEGEIREFKEGNQIVTKSFNNGVWVESATAPRFSPEKSVYKEGQIEEFKVGDEIVTRKYTSGEWVNQDTAPRYKPTTNIDINVESPLTATTRTKLQQEIIDADQLLTDLDQAEKLFDESYLTYAGKGKAALTKIADKLGVDVGKEFLGKYSAWQGIVDKQTLTYRKLITGVAGGEKEMRDIARTYINTKDDSPTTFQSKQKIYRQNALAAKKRATVALNHFGKKWGDLTPKEQENLANSFPFVTDTPEGEAESYLKKLRGE